MKIYSAQGINDFIICLGYKGYMIKEYFANYFLHMSDVTFDIGNNEIKVHHKHAEPWKVTLIDTGENTLTGGRLKRVSSYLGDEDFCFTYGDGVADVNIRDLLSFHNRQAKLATVTCVKPPGRFGTMTIDKNMVTGFEEKPAGDGTWINGGFFVLSPGVMDYIKGDETMWEKEPMENLVKAGQMAVFQHNGFWQPMDTLRDKQRLEELWKSGQAPWKVWE